MKLFSKLLCSSCAMALALSGILPIYSSADQVQTDAELVSNDGIWQPASDSDATLYTANRSAPLRMLDTDDIPTSVDNSESIYFPEIGDQGSIGSCSAWATTYYQYTYEVNKYQGIETDENNIYSPSWTYNYINYGQNIGTYLFDAYEILEKHGAMKLCDFPYSGSPSSYSYNWSTNTQKMVDALKYRVDPYTINSYSSNDLTNVKSELSDGKIGVIWTNAYGWTTAQTSTGDSIIVRGSSDGGGGHFMTVVGYDDNITTTYNNVTMTGAFKLANSWGGESVWEDGNDGFIWVAYDALNSNSAYGANWQSNISASRTPVFGSSNQMTFVNIEYYDTYYVGKVSYVSDDPWYVDIYGDMDSSATTPRFTPWRASFALQNPSYREMVFDYFTDPDTNIADYLNTQFTTRLYNQRTSCTYRIHLSVIDNLCHSIPRYDTIFGSLPTDGGDYSRTYNVSLGKGKISDYNEDQICESDFTLLRAYMLGTADLSSLQLYLADMNNDNVVNSLDLGIMRQILNSQNNSR